MEESITLLKLDSSSASARGTSQNDMKNIDSSIESARGKAQNDNCLEIATATKSPRNDYKIMQ